MNPRNSKSAGSTSDGMAAPLRERRLWVRHTLKDPRGTLIWDDGAQRTTSAASVVNISGGGAAVLALRVPGAGQLLELRLESAGGSQQPFPGQAIAASPDPSGKQLLRLRFTSWVSLDGLLEQTEERRLWQRYAARAARTSLCWLTDEGERTVGGELLNISGGGAAVVTDVEPPANAPVWVKLECPARTVDPVEARLVVISLDPSGTKVARLRFLDPCPMAFFELAVQGSS